MATQTLYNCDSCGRPIPPHTAVHQDGYILCQSCVELNGTCPSCSNAGICTLSNYNGPLDTVITRTIQTPMGYAQVQTLNPDVVKVTCKINCKCWNEENNQCNKQHFDTCANYAYSLPGVEAFSRRGEK